MTDIIDIFKFISPAIIIISLILLPTIIYLSGRYLLKAQNNNKYLISATIASIFIILCPLFYYVYREEWLFYEIKSMVALPIIFLLPGLITIKIYGKEKNDMPILDNIFFHIVTSILITGLIGLLLTVIGIFSLLNLLATIVVISVVLSWKYGILKNKCNEIKIVTSKKTIIAILIFLLAIACLFHPYQWIIGGRDPGVYVNTGANIAKTGGLIVHDSLLEELNSQKGLDFYTHNGVQFPGFYTSGEEAGKVIPQFFYLWPVWIAIFYSIFGLDLSLYVTSVFAVLSIISTYVVGKTIFNEKVGLIASLLLTLNFAQIWFSREPTTEIFTLFLVLNGLTTFILLLRETTPNRKLIAILSGICIGEILLTRIDMILLIGIIIGTIFYLWAVGKYQKVHMYFLIAVGALCALSIFIALFISLPYTMGVIKYSSSGIYSILLNKYYIIMIGLTAVTGIVISAIIVNNNRTLICRVIERVKIYRSHLTYILAFLILVSVIFAYFIRPEGDITTNSYNLVKLSWYMGGFVGILLITIGCIIMLNKKPYFESYLFILIFLTYAVFYILNARITTDHPWWVRRFLPVVIPMGIICIAYLIDWAGTQPYKYKQIKKIIPAIILLLVLIPMVYADTYIFTFKQYDNAILDIEKISGMMNDDAIILYKSNFYTEGIATPLYYVKDRDIASFRFTSTSVNHIEKWIASNKTVYLLDIININNPDDSKLQTYEINWMSQLSYAWNEELYFYYPPEYQMLKHDFSIYKITSPDDINIAALNDSGIYGEERWNGIPTRWATNNVSILMYSNKPDNITLNLSAISYYKPRTLQIKVNNETIDQQTISTEEFSQYSEVINMEKGMNEIVLTLIETPDRPIDVDSMNSLDNRNLSIALQNVTISYNWKNGSHQDEIILI